VLAINKGPLAVLRNLFDGLKYSRFEKPIRNLIMKLKVEAWTKTRHPAGWKDGMTYKPNSLEDNLL
jgi:hypothetical protein